MVYNYYYIDDMPDRVGGLIAGLKSGDKINITFSPPEGVWEEEIDRIESLRKENIIQGLILDLRLQDESNSKGKRARYRGTSLAQEVRILAKEKRLLDCPIILLSATDNLRASMDSTGNDLFDFLIEKESLGAELSYEKAQKILFALASGYECLKDEGIEINGILEYDVTKLDRRLCLDLINKKTNKPTHIIAGFILKQLILQPGPLVNVDLLSARLGTDLRQEEDKESLLKLFTPFKYSGIFSNGWDRWWFNEIDKWWMENFPETILRLLNGSDRVRLLNEKFQLKLTPLVKTDKSQSEKFWTVCIGSKAAIDTTDGFIIGGQDHLFPWQEKQYVSIDEALNRKNINVWKDVAPFEKSRFEKQLKKGK